MFMKRRILFLISFFCAVLVFIFSESSIAHFSHSSEKNQLSVKKQSRDLKESFSNNSSDPIITHQEVKLTANDGTDFDLFGTSVAISDTTIVVGAPWGVSSGSVYVFTYNGSNWQEECKRTAFDSSQFDNFGGSVAISGERVVAGATGNNSVYVFSGCNGDMEKLPTPIDDGVTSFGEVVSISNNRVIVGSPENNSAYVFTDNGTSWDRVKLTPGDGNGSFGTSVAIADNRIIVGAPRDDDNGINSGSVHIFTYDDGNWVEYEPKITAGEGSENYFFGGSVDIAGDRIGVGAPWAENFSGYAYIFAYDGAIWQEEVKLTASDGSNHDNFGESVAIDNDTLVVGSPFNSDSGTASGAAYVFIYNDDTSTWEEKRLPADDLDEWHKFGSTVAIAENRVVIGAPKFPPPPEYSASIENSSDPYSGSAYIYIIVKIGDVTCDGVIDIIDALLTARFSANLPVPPEFNENVADTNCNDFINIIDALLIARYSAGLPMDETQWCGE
jgi:hypothetical protein